MTAEGFYQQGNEARKRGQWHEAINNYIRAIELDPDSPAVEAKRMLDDIMAFYCKDMYNPWPHHDEVWNPETMSINPVADVAPGPISKWDSSVLR